MNDQNKKHSLKKILKEYGIAIIIAVSLALFIRSFLLEAFRIPTLVMKPTLLPGDVIFVSKTDFGIQFPFFGWKVTQGRDPNYGEVVIYAGPSKRVNSFIKRVVGKEGDVIGIHQGRVVFNEEVIPFSPGPSETCGTEKHPKYSYEICLEPPLIEDLEPIEIPKDSYFVLGDFRNESASQTPWAIVSRDSIRASARWIWLSVDRDRGNGLLPSFRTNRIMTSIK